MRPRLLEGVSNFLRFAQNVLYSIQSALIIAAQRTSIKKINEKYFSNFPTVEFFILGNVAFSFLSRFSIRPL